MANGKIDLNTVVMDPDPDADTTGLDRGDDFVPDEKEIPVTETKDPPAKKDPPEKKDPPAKKEPEKKEPDKKDPEKTDEERERDEKGRFVKKDGEEEEEAEDPEKDAADDKDKKDPAPKMVPLNRFNEVIQQRNELQRQLAEAAKVQKVESKRENTELKDLNTKLDGLYEVVEELRSEGKTKDAAAKQREIDGIQREIGKIEGAATARQEALSLAENRAYDGMLVQLTELIPQFDTNAPEFDQKIVNRTEFYVNSFIKGGMSPTDALREAAMAMLGRDVFNVKAEAAFQANLRKQVKEPEKKPEKKATDVPRNLAKDKKQPPEAKTTSTAERDDAPIDVVGMSDEDFDALPEAKKRELRGDVFEG